MKYDRDLTKVKSDEKRKESKRVKIHAIEVATLDDVSLLSSGLNKCGENTIK